MRLSVITPTYPPAEPYLTETYESLCAQTLADWEWVLLPNGGGLVPEAIARDPRVVVLPHSAETRIGALKRLCCLTARADKLVELDADDQLAPGALDAMAAALESADFVYSDFAEFNTLTWAPNTYRSDCGWTAYPVDWRGHRLLAHRAPPVTPQNIRYVDWAPNHVRAWTRASYLAVGGHDASLLVGDDHDLICRYYLAGKTFRYIPECLYFYRVHGKNAVATLNPAIRAQTDRNYNKYIWAMAEKWARDQGLGLIDLCGGIGCPKNYEPLDLTLGHDLNKTWPLKDHSVGVLRAYDAIEHLRDPIHTMNEAYRVLAPGGFFLSRTPSTNGVGADCDPTHVSRWNHLSFRYYTDPQFARYIPAFRGQFQDLRVFEWFPSAWHKSVNMPYIEADLVALKPGYVPMGPVRWPIRVGPTGLTITPRQDIVLVTANFGQLDMPKPISTGVQAVYYTEQPPQSIEGWRMIQRPPDPSLTARLQAKYFKCQIHRLPETASAAWLAWADASFAFTGTSFLTDWADRLLDEPAHRQALFVHHPDRRTVQEEYDFIVARMAAGDAYLTARYADAHMTEQLESWRALGYDPATAPLWCGGVWMVANTPRMHQFLDDWWAQQLQFGIMDQLPLPFLFYKHGIEPHALPVNIYTNEFFTWRR